MSEATMGGASASTSSSSGGGRTTTARRGRSRIHGSPLTPLLFLLPFLVVFVTFVLVPAFYGIWISLHDWDFALTNRPWVGLQNYKDLFDETSVTFQPFWNGMKNTFFFVLISVPFLVVLPLALALLLHRKFPGRTFFRAVYFAPFVLGIAVIGLMWKFLLNDNFGMLNGVFGLNIKWTLSQPWAWISIVLVTIWWTIGFNAIIYLAGLAGIPTDQYEAASLDGANGWQKLIHITLPGLRPVLIFIVVTTVLASANIFGQPYLITGGGPLESTRTAIMVMTELGFRQNRAGAAAAQSYILALFLMVISVINFWVMRDKDAMREGKQKRRAAKAFAQAQSLQVESTGVGR